MVGNVKEGLTKATVGRNTTCQAKLGDPCLQGGPFEFFQEDAYDPMLQRGTDISQVMLDKIGIGFRFFLQEIKYGSFKTAEAEI